MSAFDTMYQEQNDRHQRELLSLRAQLAEAQEQVLKLQALNCQCWKVKARAALSLLPPVASEPKKED